MDAAPGGCCEIAEVGDGRFRVAPAGPLTVEPVLTPRVVIAFAPAKGDQAGAVVHQLVELGVDAVMPVTLRRSVVRWDGARVEKTRDPTPADHPRSRDAVSTVAPARAAGRRKSSLSSRDAPGSSSWRPGEEARGNRSAPADGEWIALVGPEGGLDPAELELLVDRPRVSVGPHVLRAVTAPVAVAAALSGFRRAARSIPPIHPT